jgi:hypothetical protein
MGALYPPGNRLAWLFACDFVSLDFGLLGEQTRYIVIQAEVAMTNKAHKKQFGTVQRTAAAIALVLSLAPGAVQAQDSQTVPHPVQDPIAIYKQAGIDQEQEKKIMAIVNSYEKEEDAKAHAMIELLKRMRTMSMTADLDEKKIQETQSNINKIQSEMAMDKVHLLILIRRVLKENQRIKLVALLRQRNQAEGATDTAH